MSEKTAIAAESWEAHKEVIYDLYIVRDQTVDQVIHAMTASGFQASKQQYKRQFKKWGLSKNRKDNEWSYISSLLTRRSRKGKPSIVFMNNEMIPLRKLRKELSRHAIPIWKLQGPTPEPISHISVRTPESSGDMTIVRSALLSSSPPPDSLRGHQILHTQRRSLPIVTDNLPTMEFMDLIDQNLERHMNFIQGLTSRGLTFSPGFLKDVRDIAECCETSLNIIGYEIQESKFLIKDSFSSCALYSRLPEMSSGLQNFGMKQELPAFIRLFKIVVSLSVNRMLEPCCDDSFSDLVNLLQEVDPLDRFVELIANYNLYWMLEKILEMQTAATKIFAANVMLHAVEIADEKLVLLLLRSACSLDAKKVLYGPQKHECHQVGPLSIATVFQRNAKFVRILLNAGADPYENHRIIIPAQIVRVWYRIEELAETDHAVLQYFFQALVGKDHNQHQKEWDSTIQEAFGLGNKQLCEAILNNLVVLVSPQAQEHLQQLVTATSENHVFSLENCLSKEEDLKTMFQSCFLCRLVFRGCLGIAILNQNEDVSKSLIKHSSALSFNCSEIAHWVVTALDPIGRICLDLSPYHDSARAMFVVHTFGAYMERHSLFRIMSLAASCKWLDLMQLLMDLGVDIHVQNGPSTENGGDPRMALQRRTPPCLVRSRAIRIMFLECTEMIDLVLKYSGSMDLDDALCLICAVASAEQQSLVETVVQHIENDRRSLPRNSVNTLLESPELLQIAMSIEEPSIVSWLISRSVCFDTFNEEFAEWPESAVPYPWPRFAHSPHIMRSLLASGLYPPEYLLFMCALSCTDWNVENMHLVMEARKNGGCPFTKEAMTIILNIVLQFLGTIQMSTQPSASPYSERLCQCVYVESQGKSHRHLQPLVLLVEGGAVSENPWLQTALVRAKQSLNEELVDKELDSEELVWEVIRRGRGGIFHVAVEKSNFSLLEKLLVSDLSPDEWNFGRVTARAVTPLHLAALRGMVSSVRLLLQKGANVNVPLRCNCQLTALQWAAIGGHLQVVVDLIQAGADINAPGPWGPYNTALALAASFGYLDIVHVLVENNPDKHRLKRNCKIAARMARKNHRPVIADFLGSHAQKLAENLGADCEDENSDPHRRFEQVGEAGCVCSWGRFRRSFQDTYEEQLGYAHRRDGAHSPR